MKQETREVQRILFLKSPEELGLALKMWRKKLGLTQVGLAKKASTRPATISQAESGKMRLDTLFKLITALDISMSLEEKSNANNIDQSDEDVILNLLS